MRSTAACLPCYLHQALAALEAAGIPREAQYAHLASLAAFAADLPAESSPAVNSSLVLQRLSELTGVADPFAAARAASNAHALRMLEPLRSRVRRAPDPLFAALRLAVAGNIVDMGILPNFDLAKAVDDALTGGFTRDDYPAFTARRWHNVLVIGDNSGEIAFDLLLAEELRRGGAEVVYAVKGAAILNDATLEDAAQVGMPAVARVITTGAGLLGAPLSACGEDFLAELDRAAAVVAKGQANYETLEGEARAGPKTFFALQAKCLVVAGHLRVDLGASVFVQNCQRGGPAGAGDS
ncbi:MAG: ARMT1-like domain-containing protein [Bacillota bacterium]